MKDVGKQKGFGVVDIIVLILVLMLAVVIAAPLITSYEVEKVYGNIIDNANQQNDNMTIQLNKYERGWFDSKASYIISGGDEESFVIKMNDTISHGPFFLGELMAGNSPLLLAKIAGKTEINIDGMSIKDQIGLNDVIKASFVTAISWEQQCDMHGIVAAIDSTKSDTASDTVVVMDNIDITAAFDCTKFEGDLSVNLPVVYAASEGKKASIEDVSFTASQEMTTYGFPIGDFNFKVGSIAVNDGEQQFNAAGLGFNTTQTVSGETASFSIGLNVQSVLNGEEEWGPGNFGLAFNSLNASALGELSAASSQGDDQAMMMLMTILPKVFSKSPEILIEKLQVATPFGEVKGDGKASLGDVPEADLMNPFILMNSIQANAHLEGPKALIEYVTGKIREEQMLAQKAAGQFSELSTDEIKQIAAEQSAEEIVFYEAMGFVRTDGDKYSVDLEAKNGSVLVNGQPLR